MSQLSPRDRLIYNEGERLIPGVTHDYMEVRRHFGSYLFFRAAIDLDIRRGAIQPPVRIVDLGCGVGHGCARLSDLDGVQITGIDSSAESLEYAVEHYSRTNIDWKQADLIEFVADMPAYDYVVSRGVIEHIPDGIQLVQRSRWRCRLMFDVPYDEPPGGNPHHVISEIREEMFDLFGDAELFFQDLAGRIYARGQKPARPNMIMCCCRASGLPPLTRHLPLPLCPDWWKVGGPACPECSDVTPDQIQPGPVQELTVPTSPETASWFDRDTLIAEAQRRIEPADVVLDIGCGIRPQPYVRPKVLVCVDAHEEYLAILRQRFAGTHTILIEGRVPQVLQWLPDRSVDTAFLLDFIEHLDKEDGRKTIRECERIVRKQIVIFTPLGFMPQGEDEDGSDGWALHGGDWQAHRSGWTPQDFDDSWEILAAQAFHTINGKGEPLDPPCGAFWALKRLADIAESAAEDLPAIDVSAAGLQEREQTVMDQEIHHRQLQEALERQRQALAREKEHFEKDRIVRLVRGIQGLFGAGRAGSTAGGDESVKKGRV